MRVSIVVLCGLAMAVGSQVTAVGRSAAVAAGQERVRIGGPGGGPSFPAPPINAAMAPAELAAALDQYFAPLVAEDRFAGVVLLARDNTVLLERAYGLADRTHRVPNAPGTRFNIASIGKAFTKDAIEQLIAAGKLKAEDTIGALIRDYPNERARKASVEQLLGHRAGISDFFGEDFDRAPKAAFRSNRDYYAFVAPRPLYFEPGAEQRYCNGCYIVLGEIIERLTGMPYERYVAQQIFAPAGMKHSGWFATDENLPDIAMGYTRRLSGTRGELRKNVFAHGASGSAAGGVYATARDLWSYFGRKRAAGAAEAIAGGAPGTSALVEMDGPWTAIVLTNLDPPAASVGVAIVRAMRESSR